MTASLPAGGPLHLIIADGDDREKPFRVWDGRKKVWISMEEEEVRMIVDDIFERKREIS